MTHHVVSLRTYLLVFGGLLALTATTVGVSFVELGPWHVLVALLIATAKATLVVLFFMHALHSSRLVWMVIVSAVLFLGILLSQTFADYVSRGWMPGTSPAKQLRPTSKVNSDR